MKVDRTTIILATLALASIGFAERAFGQPSVAGTSPTVGSTTQLETIAPSK